MMNPFLVLLSLLVVGCSAHICMWDPPQRGSSGSLVPQQPGEDRCYQKVGPCGDQSPSVPAAFPVGRPHTIRFQQNLNHFTGGGQFGQLTVDFSANGPQSTESDFKTIHAIDDMNLMNEVSQTNFSVSVTIPPGTKCVNNMCVLRLRYVSNNPGENDRGEIFYQCADITLVASSPEAERAPDDGEGGEVDAQSAAKRAQLEPPPPCCAPLDFSTSHSLTHRGLATQTGRIYYSSTSKLIRIDEGVQSYYLNFTNGYEWAYDSQTRACTLFGLDPWVEWCFGGAANAEHEYVGRAACIGQRGMQCDSWRNGGWTVEATAASPELPSCLPSGIFGGGEATASDYSYFDATVGPADESVFQPPAACHRAAALLRAAGAVDESARLRMRSVQNGFVRRKGV